MVVGRPGHGGGLPPPARAGAPRSADEPCVDARHPTPRRCPPSTGGTPGRCRWRSRSAWVERSLPRSSPSRHARRPPWAPPPSRGACPGYEPAATRRTSGRHRRQRSRCGRPARPGHRGRPQRPSRRGRGRGPHRRTARAGCSNEWWTRPSAVAGSPTRSTISPGGPAKLSGRSSAPWSPQSATARRSGPRSSDWPSRCAPIPGAGPRRRPAACRSSCCSRSSSASSPPSGCSPWPRSSPAPSDRCASRVPTHPRRTHVRHAHPVRRRLA